jgi:hypothetical protein
LSINESIAFLSFSTGSPSQSALSFDYQLCDSLEIIYSSGLRSLLKDLDKCKASNNVLCTSNYTLIAFNEVKKGKNKGDKYSEYELVLR